MAAHLFPKQGVFGSSPKWPDDASFFCIHEGMDVVGGRFPPLPADSCMDEDVSNRGPQFGSSHVIGIRK